MPSFQSILRRTGTGAESRGPDEFLQAQFGAVGVSAIPFAVLDRIDPHPSWPPHPGFAVLGAAVFAACLAGLRFLPHRVLFAALLLAGWAWAIPFRENTAYHDFEGMFHAGVPLVLFALGLAGLRRLAGGSALPALAVAAGAAFVLSAASMGRVGHDAEAAQRQREAASDFRAMRPLTAGRAVLYPANPLARYRLAGSWTAADNPDYAVLPANLGGSLTPDNRRFHLYRPAALDDALAALAAREPAASSAFEVYLGGRTLTYVRDGCVWDDTGRRFFVHAYAAGAGDLPAERREAGFEVLDFRFADRGVRYGGDCVAAIDLPDYALRSVRTGQYDDTGHLWDEEFALDAASWLARFEALAAREPDARRAGFALRLEGRTLTLAREGCSAADVADRFFVHAYAPDGAREAIDFWFRQRGERHGDRCMASVVLPSSAVRIAAGQYDASGHLWEAALPVGE